MNRQMMNESMNQKKSNYIVVIVLTSYYVSTLLLKRYINKILPLFAPDFLASFLMLSNIPIVFYPP